MRVLRPFPPVGDINTRNAIGISPSRDSMHRVDSVYVRYGRINPLEKFDEAQNYYGGLYRVDDNPYQAIQDNPSAISRVYSIYIPTTLRSTADATAQVILSRYNRVMRRVVCALPAELAPQLGEVVNFSGPHFEMPNGEPDINIPMQCVARDRGEHQVKVELEEYRVTQARGGPVRVINIERNMVNVNLRGLYNATFGPTIAAGTQIIVQGDGVHGFGGTPAQNLGTAQPALSILASDWASDISRGVTIELRDLMIIGRSGTGGQPDPVSPSAFNGSAGRAGLLVQVPVAVSGGRIAGGGGGGGAAFAFGEIGQEGRYALGGLGAGSWGAEFFLTGSPGTTAVTPVETAIGGRGGELGMPGEPGVRSGGGNTGTGAPPGAAVIGYSHLTITGGTIINGSVSG